MCNSFEDYDETAELTAQLREARERNVTLTRLLCEACRTVFGIQVLSPPPSPPLCAWWAQHEEADRARAAAEREIQALSPLARQMLTELGPTV